MATETITLTPAGKKFWQTKKAQLRVVVTDKPVRTYGGYWSGGSINYWSIQNKNGATSGVMGVKTNPFDTAPDAEVQPTQDIAVVQGGMFNGKAATLTVYVTSKEGWTW